MTTYNMHFEITTFIESNNGINFATDYSFWIPLIDYFLVEADAFEIHCWEDEQATVDEILNALNDAACRKEGSVLIVGGELTDRAKNFLLSHPMNATGHLKWFSVFLHRKGNLLFSSEHYGTEFVGIGLDKSQREFFQKALPSTVSVLEW
ncbi:hypothetical protein ACSFXN_18315 [Planococcus sp. 1R117A]|uniref:hypothetical protein n=1 Tax=Planococcus sp. 1R117A TaxID=3447020 RepID=UPI003EDC2EF4